MPDLQPISSDLAENMRLHFIRILPGHKVMLEMSPYDLTEGRIAFRRR